MYSLPVIWLFLFCIVHNHRLTLVSPLWPYIYKSVCNCFKDRLTDRHSCLNLYSCVIKFNQSLSLLFSANFQSDRMMNILSVLTGRRSAHPEMRHSSLCLKSLLWGWGRGVGTCIHEGWKFCFPEDKFCLHGPSISSCFQAFTPPPPFPEDFQHKHWRVSRTTSLT